MPVKHIRAARRAYEAAVALEMELEVEPGSPRYPAYVKAMAASRELEARLDELTAEVLARPVTQWTDLVAIAELIVAHGGAATRMDFLARFTNGAYVPSIKARELGAALIEGTLKLGSRG